MLTKPRLLLIAGYFPPVRISTGSIRSWNLARHLTKLGWEVTVVTPKISVWNPEVLDDVENTQKEIIESGIKVIYTNHWLKCLAPWRYNLSSSKLYWFLGGILRVLTRSLGIQNWVGWVPGALLACRNLKPNDVDVILATGAPFWGFEIAYQLSRRLNKPYLMDYRDLWTNNPWSPVKEKWVTNHERRLLKRCTLVTIVSPLSGEALSRKYQVSMKLRTITNGYDKNDLQNIDEKHFDHFSIVYAGGLNPPKRTLYPILRILKMIKDHGIAPKKWGFHYFGRNIDFVENEIRTWGLEEQSTIHGDISRKEVLSYIKGASLNVVIESQNEHPTLEDIGVIPGKVYELIGLNANILSIVPKGSAVEGILSSVGVPSFDTNETEMIIEFIIKSMNGFRYKLQNQDKYSWESLSREFDVQLKQVLQIRYTLK